MIIYEKNNPPALVQTNNAAADNSIWQEIKKRAFPSVHGAYASHREEIMQSLPSRWTKMFENLGFEIAKTFTVRFVPFENRWAIALFEKSGRLTGRLGGLSPFKYWGVHFCIVAKRTQG